jgi:hypothetical protein
VAETIGQQRFIGLRGVFFDPRLEESPRALTQWKHALLTAFTCEPNGLALILGDVSDAHMDDLGNLYRYLSVSLDGTWKGLWGIMALWIDFGAFYLVKYR